jgi:hypothetical protein
LQSHIAAMQDETPNNVPIHMGRSSGFSKPILRPQTKNSKAGLDAVVLADAIAVVVFQLAEDNGGKNG